MNTGLAESSSARPGKTSLIFTEIVINVYVDQSTSVVLASSSPRRKYLLEALRVSFDSLPPDVDEQQEPEESIDDYVLRLSLLKWQSIAELHPRSLVISADTTVEGPDGDPMHKPDTIADAEYILSRLRGRTVRVVTGVATGKAGEGSDPPSGALCVSRVTFAYFTDARLAEYLKSELPIGKAGAFGIQDELAAPLIAGYTGCYTNIVGLPLCVIADAVRPYGVLAASSLELTADVCGSPGCPIIDGAAAADRGLTSSRKVAGEIR